MSVVESGEAGALAIRGGMIRAGAYVVSSLLALISVPFMTRHLGRVDYGYYATVSSLLFILVGLTEAGLTALGIREYTVRRGADREGLLRNLLGLRLLITGAGVGLAVAFAALTGRPSAIVAGAAIMGLGMLLTLTQQTYAIPLSAELRLGWVSALEVIKQVVLSGGAVLMVVLGAGLLSFFWVVVAAGTVMLVLTLVLLREEAWLKPAFDPAVWRSILRQTAAYALAAAAGLAYFRVALLTLGFVSTDAAVGLYGAAFKIIETLGVIPLLLVSSAFPILAHAAAADRERLRYAVRSVLEVSLTAGVPLGLGLMISAPFAIKVVGGADYEDAVLALQIHAMGMLTTFVVAGGSLALLAMERYRALLTANAIALAVSLILTIVLGGPYAQNGAAVATFAAETVLVIGYLVALGRDDHHLLPPATHVLRVLPGAAAMLAVWMLMSLPPLAEAAIAGIVYVPLAFAFGAVPRELLDAVLRRGSKEAAA